MTLIQEQFPFLSHTWLQPGDQKGGLNGKPFKRFPANSRARGAWLKPGVNEMKVTALLKLDSCSKGIATRDLVIKTRNCLKFLFGRPGPFGAHQ